jgi:hypothetical protein
MKFQYKSFFFIFVKLYFCFLGILFFQINSWGSSFSLQEIPPSKSLSLPTASLAAYSGVGAASPGDYSSADVNPAILSALKRQYTIFGDTAWQRHINLMDVGVLDSTTTHVATLIRVRESVPSDEDTRDRRFGLGLSFRVPKTSLSVGLSLDYEELMLSSLTSYKAENFFGGAGLFYEYVTKSERPIFAGVSINRLFDTYNDPNYDAGLATAFLKGFYTVGIDGLFTSLSGLQKVVSTMSIAANPFLDLKGSYGYDILAKKQVWGAGIFFKAPVLHLFYTFANSDSSDTTTLRQTAGFAFNFAF